MNNVKIEIEELRQEERVREFHEFAALDDTDKCNNSLYSQ